MNRTAATSHRRPFPSVFELLVFAVLAVVGVVVRVELQHLPNFAPVAALALFAGYYFRPLWLAAALPLVVMGVSDAFIGGYDWRVMAVVYAVLALPVLFRGPLRASLPLRRGKPFSAAVATGGLCLAGLGASVLFFVTTNFAHWMFFMEEPGLAGLASSYTAAIPFFRFTLAGDLTFASLLFGGYALGVNLGWSAESPAPAPLTTAAG